MQRYVASLPEVGVMPAVTTPMLWQAERSTEPSSRHDDLDVAGVRVRRYAFEHRAQCAARVTRAGDGPPERLSYEQGVSVPCERLSARVDRARGLLVLHGEGRWSDTNSPFDLATLESLGDRYDATLRFRDAFSLPRSWLWGSAAILALALVALAAPRRAHRMLSDWKSWRQGTLRGDGMIAFDDGSVVPCPYGAALAPGPVVLLEGAAGPAPSSPFRGAATSPAPERDAVHQGTVAEVIGRFEARVDARYAYVVAASLLSAAPWFAALAEGLLV